jgi:hypothetical protein
MDPMVKRIRKVHHNTKLVAEIECESGTARAGQWVWRVRTKRGGKAVARSASTYRRRFAAQRGLARHFPQVAAVKG